MTNKIITEEEVYSEKVVKKLPTNVHYDQYKINNFDSRQSLIKSMMTENGLSYNINRQLLEKAQNDLDKDNKMQSQELRDEICADSKKIVIVDIIIILSIIRYLIIYGILPLIYGRKDKDLFNLHKNLKFYFKKYTSRKNIFIFILYIIITIVFISFSNYQLQNIGIVMFISFITSIAAASNLLITGALFSGITIYIFLRLRQKFFSPKEKLDKCNVSLWQVIKNIIISFIHKIEDNF